MSNASQHEILLNALVDGELSVEEREDALRLIASNPEYAQYVNQLQAQRDRFSGLPKFSLSDNFADKVLKAAQQNTTAGAEPPSDTTPLAHAPTQPKQRSHVTAILAIASLAAMLLFALYVGPTSESAGPMAAVTSQPGEPADEARDDEARDNVDNSNADSLAQSDDVEGAGEPESFAGGDPHINLKGGRPDEGAPAPNAPQSDDVVVLTEEQRMEMLRDGFQDGMNRSGNGVAEPPSAMQIAENDIVESDINTEDVDGDEANSVDQPEVESQLADAAPENAGQAGLGGEPTTMVQSGSAGANILIAPRSHNELVIVELDNRDQLAAIEQILWDNSIQTSLPAGQQQQQAGGQYELQRQVLANANDNSDGFEAVCVFASPDQMQHAIEDLSEQTNVVSYQFPTEVVSLPGQAPMINADVRPESLEPSQQYADAAIQGSEQAGGGQGGGGQGVGGQGVGGRPGGALGEYLPNASQQSFAFNVPRNIDLPQGQTPELRESEAKKLMTLNNAYGGEPVVQSAPQINPDRDEWIQSRGASPDQIRLLRDLQRRQREREESGPPAQQEFDAAPEEPGGHTEGLAIENLDLDPPVEQLQPYYILFRFAADSQFGREADALMEEQDR